MNEVKRATDGGGDGIVLDVATAGEREEIYRLRHAVYACELGQHHPNAEGRLSDVLDAYNEYVVARWRGELVGFVSITPPGCGPYSIDKYLGRDELPFPRNERLYEVRLLTVVREARGLPVAGLLMYAALRWVETGGGERVVAIGRQEVLSIYLKAGLRPLGRQIRSGEVTFELLTANVSEARAGLTRFASALHRLKNRIDWRLPMPFDLLEPCLHGGAFFKAVGEEFDRLDERARIINADVLDAWFPPSPKAVAVLREHLPWLLQTSPPTHSEGLVRVLSRTRGVAPENLLAGAGSSALIFLAFREWLTAESRVLLPDPTYGEYAHALENMVGCRVERLPLPAAEGFDLDPARLAEHVGRGCDLLVLVNPNSPTGRHVPRAALEPVLAAVPSTTRVWVDETYVEYSGSDESLERFAAASANVVVCKSMSKVYALSGARAAYLCGPAALLDGLRRGMPPWAVGLLAQVAAVEALKDPEYYAARYAETRRLRDALASDLRVLGLDVVPSTTNFLLCHLPETGPDAATVQARCRAAGLFLRDAGGISPNLGRRMVRIAVKDAATNARIVEILATVLAAGS